MPDLGVAPDREVTGPFFPGDDTGLHITTGGGSDPHWPGIQQMAILVSARLGSLAAGAETKVLVWDHSLDGYQRVWFSAQRSADGSSVDLEFHMFVPGIEDHAEVAVPWEGPDHLYAWGYSNNSWSAVGDVPGSGGCTVGSQPIDASGSTFFGVEFTKDSTGYVDPTAPSDLVVEYAASWYDIDDPVAPTLAQLEARVKRVTCRRMFVGMVGMSGV